MEPTLRAGDWLLVDPDAYRDRLPSAGELVVADDPRRAGRLIVKRAVGSADGAAVRLVGDHSGHADEPGLAAVPRTSLIGRPWLRYWPPRRFGRVG
jgi:hypothetical protein